MAWSSSTIVTGRLTLTPLEVDDADSMVAVLGDERMYEFTGGRPLTLTELRARYERLVVGHSADHSEVWFNWTIRLSTDAQPVGAMQATVSADGSSADVAWEVGLQWQGQGVASEAATAVVGWLIDHNVAVVHALVHPDHHASSAVAERAGLEPTKEFIDGEVVWRLTTTT